MSGKVAYVWWPGYLPTSVELADTRSASRHVMSVVAFTVVLCLPPVTRATGISATSVALIIGAHLAWYLAGAYLYREPALRPARYQLLVAGNLTVNIFVAVAIPTLTHDPRTPLWMLPVLYACLNGAVQEREPSIAFLLAHALSPLVALVPLLAGGVVDGWSIAAPVLCGAICGASYNHLAGVSARSREVRSAHEEALASLRARVAARDRERLARDLEGSVGSTLAVVGLYGDLIERNVDRPHELRSLASMVRDAARAGLGDLRGVIGAMAPAAADVDGLAGTLRQAAARATEGTPTDIVVRVTRGGAALVDARIRLALVRVFQETLRAAVRQAVPHRIEARVASEGETIAMEIAGDGSGGDATLEDRVGSRVTELGGTFSLTTEPERGFVIKVSLPQSRAQETTT